MREREKERECVRECEREKERECMSLSERGSVCMRGSEMEEVMTPVYGRRRREGWTVCKRGRYREICERKRVREGKEEG